MKNEHAHGAARFSPTRHPDIDGRTVNTAQRHNDPPAYLGRREALATGR